MGRAWRTDATFYLSDTKGTVLADHTFSYATAEPSLPSLAASSRPPRKTVEIGLAKAGGHRTDHLHITK